MQRAYDMLIHDIALQNLPVRLAMDRAGLSGDDGPTHHGLFDIGYLRHVPNFIFMAAKDEDEFVDMLWTMAQHDSGPERHSLPARHRARSQTEGRSPGCLKIGEAEVLHDGHDVALISLGHMIDVARGGTRAARRRLGYSVALINARWIKPLDTGVLERFATRSARCSAPLRIMSSSTALAPPSSITCMAPGCTPRSNASPGRMPSSSMAK